LKKVKIDIRRISFVFFLPFVLLSNTVIQGRVTNKRKEALYGANVFLEGTLDGASADKDGNFRFVTEETGKYNLQVRMMGYETFRKEILFKGETINIEVKLKEEVLESEGVTVKASSFTTGEESGVTLTPLEVVMTPGAAADICWAIKSFPGVQQVEEGAGLFVRGGEITETKFILDGANVYHPYRYESPTGGFFGTFTPFLLKGTYFSSGGFGAEYGNALSGILYMESLDLPSERSISLGVGLGALSVMGSIPVSDNLGINFSGNHSNTKLMFDFNDVEDDFTEYPFSYDLNLNLAWRYSEKGRAKIFFFKEKDNVGVYLQDPTWGGNYYGTENSELYNFIIDHALSDNTFFKFNVSRTDFEKETEITIGEEAVPDLLDLNETDEINQAKITFEKKTFMFLKLGGSLKQRKSDFEGFVPSEEDTLDPSVPSNYYDREYKSYINSVFLEETSFFPYDLSLTSGIRFDYDSKSAKNAIDPRLSLSWKTTDKITLSFATGIFHQFYEPWRYDPDYGNPDLDPMEARHYIISGTWENDGGMIRVEGYYKDYEKLMREDDSLNFLSTGYGYARGIDFFVKKSFGKIEGRVSYSHLKSKRNWMDYPGLFPPNFDITHNLSAVLNFNPVTFFQLAAKYIYATGKPFTPAGEDFRSARLPSYWTLDLSASYLHSFFGNNLTVFYFAVNNVTNRNNILGYYNGDRDEPIESSYGRLYYFGVSFQM
jgi:vitamin B12 transporter